MRSTSTERLRECGAMHVRTWQIDCTSLMSTKEERVATGGSLCFGFVKGEQVIDPRDAVADPVVSMSVLRDEVAASEKRTREFIARTNRYGRGW